ncbi:MAG: class I SAM-dependent methyltransferase [Patescibacteria group bacterium]|nr:class I SAM-dependent methyltransferase [Patescibacteria group bacterium]
MLVFFAFLLMALDLLLVWFMLRGAPYVPTRPGTVEKMLKLAGDVKGKKVIDIGSGDGRIVMAFAQNGAHATGIELNPLLVKISRKKVEENHLEDKAEIVWQDMWKTDFHDFDLLTVFGVFHVMPALAKKIRREMKPGSKIISLAFKFPHWKIKEDLNGIYLYEV